MKEMKAIDELIAKANELGENSWWETYEVEAKEWKKYGKDRTYVNLHCYSNGKWQKSYKVGWCDNINDTCVFTY